MRVMSAIEACRTAALGGHVTRCEDCAHIDIAYNSCRNRHCPKCQAAAAYDWLEARRAELLPVPYYHVVFTLPAPIADIAYTNKAVIYDALFKAASETLLRIAADPKHLGAKIGVLHTWGSALTHHPHVHCVVPGGGLSSDGKRWISCEPGFFLSVRVLSRLFRRLMCQRLTAGPAPKNASDERTHRTVVPNGRSGAHSGRWAVNVRSLPGMAAPGKSGRFKRPAGKANFDLFGHRLSSLVDRI